MKRDEEETGLSFSLKVAENQEDKSKKELIINLNGKKVTC